MMPVLGLGLWRRRNVFVALPAPQARREVEGRANLAADELAHAAAADGRRAADAAALQQREAELERRERCGAHSPPVKDRAHALARPSAFASSDAGSWPSTITATLTRLPAGADCCVHSPRRT